MNDAEAERLATVLARVQRELNRHDRLAAATAGIGSAEDLQVLRLLLSDGPLRVGELAARRSSSVATASARLDRLEQRGLIIRERRPSDRRAVVAILTDKGKTTANANRTQRQAALRQVNPEFPTEHLDEVVEALTDSLDEVRANAAGAAD